MNIFVKIFSKSFCEIWDRRLKFTPVLFWSYAIISSHAPPLLSQASHWLGLTTRDGRFGLRGRGDHALPPPPPPPPEFKFYPTG